MALHRLAEQFNLPLPTFLMIDSPMKNIGTDVNKDIFLALYKYIYVLSASVLKETQLIIADTDIARLVSRPDQGRRQRAREQRQPGGARESPDRTWKDTKGEVLLGKPQIRGGFDIRPVIWKVPHQFLRQHGEMAGFFDVPDRRTPGLLSRTGDRKLSPGEEKSPNDRQYPPILPLSIESGTSSHFAKNEWRRERDSNPRCPLGQSGFQDRLFQPLTHPSAG